MQITKKTTETVVCSDMQLVVDGVKPSKGSIDVKNPKLLAEYESSLSYLPITAAAFCMSNTGTLILNDAGISITDAEKGTTASQATYGVYMQCTGNTLFDADSKKAKISVNRTTTGSSSCGAIGLYSAGDLVAQYEIYSPITVTGTSKKEAGMTVYGIITDSTFTASAGISGAIKATASSAGTSATVTAYGIYSTKKFAVGANGINKDITATVTSKGAAVASCIKSSKGEISITGAINGAIKATVTAKRGGYTNTAYVLDAGNSSITISKGVMKDIVSNISSESTAYAKCFLTQSGSGVITIGSTTDSTKKTNYAINGVISATSKVTAASANATCFAGFDLSITGSINKKITATATATALADSKMGMNATSYGFMFNHNATIANTVADKKGVCNAIMADITTKSTATAKYNKKTGNYKVANASSYALFAQGILTVNGNITKNISATATANTVKVGSTVMGGTGFAIAIYSANADFSNCDILGKISATATAKGDQCTVYCIQGPDTVKFKNTFGTLSATANGDTKNKNTAYGIMTKNLIYYSDDNLTGKITVTNKTGDATGVQFHVFKDGKNSRGGRMTANISVTGLNAIGVKINATTDAFFYGSTITAKTSDKKLGTAYAIMGADGNQTVTFREKTKVTGDVSLGKGNDSLDITGKSTVTGNIDFGDGNDFLTLDGSSKIKGNVTNVNNWDIDDYVSGTVWEGTEFSFGDGNQSFTLTFAESEWANISKLKSGKSKTYSFMKDTDGNKENTWDQLPSMSIRYSTGGSSSQLVVGGLTYKGTRTSSLGYDLSLTSSKDGKTLQLTIKKN